MNARALDVLAVFCFLFFFPPLCCREFWDQRPTQNNKELEEVSLTM